VSAGNGRPEAVDAVPAPWPVDQAVLAAAAAEGRGVISVSRSARGFRDILRAYKIVVGSRAVGSIKRGQQVDLPVKAGQHKVELKIDWCSSPALTVEVEPGAVTRLYCEPGGSPRGGARQVLDAPGEYIRLTQLIG
jgi:hypothetical protein